MLAELGGRLFREAFAHENTPEDMQAYLGRHFTPAALSALLAAPSSQVLILEEEEEVPIGWALLLSGEAVEIRRFYVDRRFQGGDAAPTLMQASLERARALGAGRIWLAVWEHNGRARRFYARHGFRKVGTQPFQLGSDIQTDEVLSRPVSFGVTLAIVAGGGATRLGGVCKPLLRVGGRTVLQRLLGLRTLADEVLLASADPRIPDDLGLRRVPDLFPGRGAPGGVHSALAHARSPWVLAVAGDMPFLDGRAVLPLLEARRDDVDAVAYTVGGRLEPLAALYRSALAPRWAAALGSDEPSFRRLWDGLRGLTLPEAVLREATGDTRAVLSLNSVEDMATWVDAPPES